MHRPEGGFREFAKQTIVFVYLMCMPQSGQANSEYVSAGALHPG